MTKNINELVGKAAASIISDYDNKRDIDKINTLNQPDNEVVIDCLNKLMNILFPGYYEDKIYKNYSYKNRISVLIEDVFYNLMPQVEIALKYKPEFQNISNDEIRSKAEESVLSFLNKIPMIREYVDTDLQATFEGDPAALSKDEIVLSYPGFYASTVSRIAHELYILNIPIIPRMMTEHAHSKTGIDINPGATIGKYFMMDHGTGIVIGETSIIGNHVQIYQGVTIGALSTRGGQSLKGQKRHPTIEDNVTIYSGASIFGGETVIGENTVIGSSVFITSSIKPNSRVSVQNRELVIKERKKHNEPADTNASWS